MRLVENDKGLSLGEVVAPTFALRFESFDLDYSVGMAEGYWLRVDLTQCINREDLYIQFLYPVIELVRFHYQRTDLSWQSAEAGSVVDVSEWPVAMPKLTFPLQPVTGDFAYFEIESSDSQILTLEILDQTRLQRVESWGHAFLGIYLGIIIFAVVYNTVMFFVLRDKSYLYYVLFCCAIAGASLNMSGMLQFYLFQNHVGASVQAGVILTALNISLATLFIRSFIELENIYPKLDKLLSFVPIPAIALIIPAVLSHASWQITASIIYVVLVGGLLTYVGIGAALKGHRSARFLVLAWSPAIAYYAVNMPMLAGYIEANHFTLNTIPIASVLEVVLLSLGLADRINSIQKNQRRLQQLEFSRVQEHAEKLIEIDQLKDDFLAKTSHELRTPLHSIMGLANKVSREGLTPSIQEANNLILKSAQRLTNLVNDILDFTQIKNQNLNIQTKSFDIDAVVSFVVNTMEPMLFGKEVSLIYESPEDSIWVKADEDRVHQILMNLMGNAIKFTHQGSVRIEVTREDKLAIISVTDTGIGIKPEELATILTPFQQGQSATQAQIPGTGIGLPLTKQLVELHGGTLEMESVPDQGTCVRFSLPLTEEQEQVNEPSPENNSTLLNETDESPSLHLEEGEINQREGNIHILAVDDDPTNLQVLKTYLDLSRYQLTMLTDPSKVMAFLEKEHVDIVLLDVMMPGISGTELCRMIRTRYNIIELPVIFLSAKGQVQDICEGLSLGANDYIIKPFSSEELVLRVENTIQQIQSKRFFEATLSLANQDYRQTTSPERIADLSSEFQTTLDLDLVLAISESTFIFEHNHIGFFESNKLFELVNRLLESNELPEFLDSVRHPELLEPLIQLYVDQQGKNLIGDIGVLFLDNNTPTYLVVARLANKPKFTSIELNFLEGIAAQLAKNQNKVQAIMEDKYLLEAVASVQSTLDQLVYVKSMPPYCMLCYDCSEQKSKDVRVSLSNLSVLFKTTELVQVHRSYAVNPIFVRNADREGRDYRLLVKDGFSGEREVPISRGRIKELRENFPQWFLK